MAYTEQAVVLGFHLIPLVTWQHVVANKSIFLDLTLSGQFSQWTPVIGSSKAECIIANIGNHVFDN